MALEMIFIASLGIKKYKFNSQRGCITHLLECLKLKRLFTPRADQDVEQLDLSRG